MGKYVEAGQATDDIVVLRMCFACYVPKATNTRSEYVILRTFLRYKLLQKRTCILRYTYIDILGQVKFWGG